MKASQWTQRNVPRHQLHLESTKHHQDLALLSSVAILQDLDKYQGVVIFEHGSWCTVSVISLWLPQTAKYIMKRQGSPIEIVKRSTQTKRKARTRDHEISKGMRDACPCVVVKGGYMYIRNNETINYCHSWAEGVLLLVEG